MPPTAQPMAATMRAFSRSPRKMRDSSATAAGMPDIVTPAATAEVIATP